MPERRNKPERRFKEIVTTGREGTVWQYKEGRRQGQWVIKTFGASGEDPRGFYKERARTLREHYEQLVAQYGNLIPKQKIMPRQDGYHYFLAQERLVLAKPADVFDYLPSTFPEAAKAQLALIIEQELEGFFDFLGRKPARFATPVPLDLGPGNLLLTKDKKVRYVDTGLGISSYDQLREDDLHHYEMHCRHAQLDLLRGRPVAEVVNDLVYSIVKAIASHLNPRAFERSIGDADALMRLYGEVFLRSPYRGYLDPDFVDFVKT